MIAIQTPQLFDGETLRGPRTVLIEAGRIAEILEHTPPGVAVTVLPPGSVLAPGFVDVQVNGGGGVLFDGASDVAALRQIALAHIRLGTTGLLPTLISGTRPDIAHAIETARAALQAGVPGIAGLHIEGPFISLPKRGIHPAANITAMTDADVAMLCGGFPAPRLITVAPEAATPARIAALKAAGYTVFIGHSDAATEAAEALLAAGAFGFTHLYNAMSPLTSRAPGVVGAALASATAVASIIVDGLHVHPAAIRAAWQALGPARLFLISDAMPSVGDPAGGGFSLYGKAITLAAGRLTDAAGTLAGAHLTMREAVRDCVRLAGIPLADALRMATATPADAVGLHDHGRIRPGGRADLVALTPGLELAGVWLAGEPIR